MNAPINSSLTAGRQGFDYQATYDINGVKVRITIKTDSHDFQSRAVAEVWSPTELRWNEAARLAYGAMESAGIASYCADQDFAAEMIGYDNDELLARVADLLS